MAARTENAADLGRIGLRSSDVESIQKIARSLHRIDERGCNEDLSCPKCEGMGHTDKDASCAACAGSGLTTGKREARLEGQAEAIAQEYGLRIYRQGDCRGWPLYLIPNHFDQNEDESYYNMRGTAVCPH